MAKLHLTLAGFALGLSSSYIVHLGIDHQLSDDLKVFAEYYREAETAALASGGLSDFDASIGVGHAIAVGVRYDF